MFCSWDMGHLEAQCMSGANHGSIQFLPLVLRFLCEISSSFNQPRYSDRTQAIQVVLFPIQKQGKTMRLSEFANWTTGPWTFNRSPHGLNGHVLLISYIYIWIWSNYTELSRRHPQIAGFVVRESPPKCQENSGSRLRFIVEPHRVNLPWLTRIQKNVLLPAFQDHSVVNYVYLLYCPVTLGMRNVWCACGNA